MRIYKQSDMLEKREDEKKETVQRAKMEGYNAARNDGVEWCNIGTNRLRERGKKRANRKETKERITQLFDYHAFYGATNR